MEKLSIILPAKNEADSLRDLLPAIKKQYPEAQIIIVNDGSTDDTGDLCKKLAVTEIRHPQSRGNGAAIKSGARAAKGDVLVFMDADGQHSPDDIEKLLEKLREGYQMVVGARHASSQSSVWRRMANGIYNMLASWMVNQKVLDLTSGFRVVYKDIFLQYLYMLPNGFSYPTTITMAIFRGGYSIAYLPINVKKNFGKSHISPFKDGIRFFLIIFRVGTLYSPLKLFFPLAAISMSTGVGYYLYTYFSIGRFTNMSALLITLSVLIFLIGLVSEQITNLFYFNNNKD
ncbi:MAG: glycosyltransferase family 2 protein [Gammaproteobacteria bacterium]|nr:glycosyltransferase family 2 protein [Gammaproteobacteria bacterium]